MDVFDLDRTLVADYERFARSFTQIRAQDIAERSPAAVTKQTTGRTEDGLPVHSFRTLLGDLATLTRNTLVTALDPEHPFSLTARPTPLQQKAYDLLALSCTQ